MQCCKPILLTSLTIFAYLLLQSSFQDVDCATKDSQAVLYALLALLDDCLCLDGDKQMVLCTIRLFKSLLDVFGDGLGSLRDGVSGEFSGQDELDGGLDFAGRESSPLVEPDELGALSGDPVEGVVDEGVHDVHGLLGNADVGVHLLQHLVDVDGEGLDSSSSGFSVSGGLGGFGLSRFLSHQQLFITYPLKFNLNAHQSLPSYTKI